MNIQEQINELLKTSPLIIDGDTFSGKTTFLLFLAKTICESSKPVVFVSYNSTHASLVLALKNMGFNYSDDSAIRLITAETTMELYLTFVNNADVVIYDDLDNYSKIFGADEITLPMLIKAYDKVIVSVNSFKTMSPDGTHTLTLPELDQCDYTLMHLHSQRTSLGRDISIHSMENNLRYMRHSTEDIFGVGNTWYGKIPFGAEANHDDHKRDTVINFMTSKTDQGVDDKDNDEHGLRVYIPADETITGEYMHLVCPQETLTLAVKHPSRYPRAIDNIIKYSSGVMTVIHTADIGLINCLPPEYVFVVSNDGIKCANEFKHVKHMLETGSLLGNLWLDGYLIEKTPVVETKGVSDQSDDVLNHGTIETISSLLNTQKALDIIGGTHTGKTTAALFMAVQLINAGKSVVFVTSSEDPRNLRARCVTFGLTDNETLLIYGTENEDNLSAGLYVYLANNEFNADVIIIDDYSELLSLQKFAKSDHDRDADLSIFKLAEKYDNVIITERLHIHSKNNFGGLKLCVLNSVNLTIGTSDSTNQCVCEYNVMLQHNDNGTVNLTLK